MIKRFGYRISGLFLLLFVLIQTEVFGEEPVKIKRLIAPVEFDGVPNDSAWNDLSKFELIMFRPHFGTEPSEPSEVRMGYDNQFLWIGASLFMKDPSRIFAVSKKRDEMLFDYDAFGIILDTYNDNENGLAFFTTPTGLRTDYSISNDAAGGGGGGFSFMNISWNTFWDVKTSIDEKGWYVEMRIPLSSLKFKSQNDIATMGLIISRNISSNNETDTYPALDPKYGFMSMVKPSLATAIEISGARPLKPVYISPYVIAGTSYDQLLNEPGTEYIKKSPFPQWTANAGIDIKYNVNSNLTVDLTANTDFAQVEADDQQVNLTRYSLFFPEKRMFFQERSNLFDFSLGGFSENLFYSRNIGISNGQPVRIYGGARLTGRIGKWDLGFLDMQTAEDDETSGENFGVLRMRRQVINQNSYVGGILTSRLGMNGSQNIAYGVDGIFRLFGDDYLNVKWAQTYDNNSESSMASLSPSFIYLNWERRSEKGFGYSFNYIHSGGDFNPGIGFIMRRGIQGFNSEIRYGWIPGEKSKLFRYNISVRGLRYARLEDGKLESSQISPSLEISTKKGFFGNFALGIQQEGVIFDFNLSDSVKINAGTYTFTDFQAMFGVSQTRKISFMGGVNAGEFYDGFRLGFRIEPEINLSSSLSLSPMYSFDAIRFPDRITNNTLNIHSVSLKTLFMLNTKLSASFLIQYVNTQKDLITNFRIRYNPREGNDLYLVYNDYRGIAGRSHVPELPAFFNKTVMVKYIHTFTL